MDAEVSARVPEWKGWQRRGLQYRAEGSAVEKPINSIFSKLDLPDPQDVSRRVKATLIYLAEDSVDGSA